MPGINMDGGEPWSDLSHRRLRDEESSKYSPADLPNATKMMPVSDCGWGISPHRHPSEGPQSIAKCK
jgi:hypothetical protein